MRRFSWGIWISTIVCVLCSCGQLDINQVVSRINKDMENLESYQAKAKMVMHTGEQPLTYQIEVWYKNPDYYRIYLANEDKNISQIILKNQEGVFVLTPELKKSFRFQSNWPEKQSQVYLYQSLMKHILEDTNRTMAIEAEQLVFDVNAHYAHEQLTHQRIWLTKEKLIPTRVEVVDKQEKTVIQVEFTSFDMNPQFDDQAFDRERNLMSSSSQTWPVVANNKPHSNKHFGIIEPTYVPSGTQKKDVSKMIIDQKPAILVRYQGAYSFSLIEYRPQTTEVYLGDAEIVDLGHTRALLSGSETKCLTWLTNGVEFRIVSKQLPLSEMIKIAQSMEGQSGKS